MTSKEFVKKAKDIVAYKTLYVNGCFGSPLNDKNKIRYTNNTEYNKRAERTCKILNASSDTYGFDCVGLIKGILWGWKGDNSTYGGATYCSNNVPDISEAKMIALSSPSTDFSKIVDGAVVWMSGHIGIYIGDGLVVEASPKWKDCVQITACANVEKKAGYNSRIWTKWGKLPYIVYEDEEMVNEITIKYNGKLIKVHTICKDDTNYIKLKELDTILDVADVSWDGKYPVVNKR